MAKHALIEAEPETPPRKRKHLLWIIPLTLAILAGAIYGGGVWYFSEHFLPNTTVEGDDVSLQTTDELAALIESRSGDYQGTFVGDGFEIPFDGDDIGYSYDGDAYAAEAMSQQNTLNWPIEYAGTHHLTATLVPSFDADRVWDLFEPVIADAKKALDGLPHRGVHFDEESDHYVVSDESRKVALDRDQVIDATDEAIQSFDATIEIGPECYGVDPEAQAIVDAANFYADAKVHITMNGVDAIDVDGKQISQWIKIADDGTVTLDEQAILDWGPGGLSDILDTVGKPRTYTRPDGEKITVVGGGPYGWIINGAESAKLILAAIKSGKPQTVDIPTYQNADRVEPGGQDWPDKYIDVDISEQHARMYIDGELVWETDIVTGEPDGIHDTPQGVFFVSEHETDVTLFNQGTVPEGETYEENEYNPDDGWISHVDFWIAYDRGERGFHNADWRWQFGKDDYGTYIYTYYGSHGCINMDYEPARQLFDLTELGDAVVIHE
ncbi:MAG: L,D-transpeptidase family protein [Atopobiaceae bacterium]|nr:L,D-transpeptidase family protein [Atopobiaceae bacterium]